MKENIYWTTIIISFVLLIHDGTESTTLFAYSLIPAITLLFYKTKSLKPLTIFLLLFGTLERYRRYFSHTYASDTLLAVRDFIGHLLAGNNMYQETIMAQSGKTPFTYLPFSLLWYLPAQILTVDLRFFEMLIACLVPLLVYAYGVLTGRSRILPILAIISVTPFLLELSVDGSNDNSAILLFLLALVLLVKSIKAKSGRWAIASAITLACAAMFKHYMAFYLIFFIPFLWRAKQFLPIPHKKYLLWMFLTIGAISLPFVITAPIGFAKSLLFIEIDNYHTTWGWNVWVAIENYFGLVFSKETMWLVRTSATLLTFVLVFKYLKLTLLRHVYIAGSLTMLTYLILSNWTTSAYFTFLIPLLGLSALPAEKKDSLKFI